MDENRRRRKEKKKRQAVERMRRVRQAGRYQAPIPAWPENSTAIDQFSDGELYAVAIHPMVTGLGLHPRTISDEDWVVAFIKRMTEYGYARVLADLLDVLNMTAHLWIGREENAKAGPYPTPKTDSKLPMPKVDTESKDGKWTGGMVRGILLNPVHAGIVPFPATIPKEQWIDGFISQLRHSSLKQQLVDMLFCLRKTYGFPGSQEPAVPYGYTLAGADDYEDEGEDESD